MNPLSPFRKSEPPIAKIPTTPQAIRSRFAQMLEHIEQAYMHLDRVAQLSSSLIMDIQTGLKYIDQMRKDVVEAVGQQIDEEEIKQYAPPQYRNGEVTDG